MRAAVSRFLLTRFYSRTVLFIVLLVPTATWGQDITVGPAQWLGPGPAPEQLPSSRHLSPDVPDDLKAADEPFYVLVTKYVDSHGDARSTGAEGTDLALKRVVEAEFRDWEYPAARLNGIRVDTHVVVPVLFNPRSATLKGPNAIPRLLEIHRVLVPHKPTPAGQPPIIPVLFSVDETGAVVSIKSLIHLGSLDAPAVDAALKTWRFAPARQGGKPIASEITLRVFCEHAPTTDSVYVPAKALKRVAPIFPQNLVWNGSQGEVVVGFTVTADGAIQDVLVIRSSNPALNDPALNAVRQWRFTPAIKDGQPVASKMQVPVTFEIGGGRGEEPFSVEGSRDLSKLPPEFRYDIPPKPRGVVLPVYPYAMLNANLSGRVTARFVVNEFGVVTDVQTPDASRPEFGFAMIAALEAFSFDPARKGGKPSLALLGMEQKFRPDHAGMGETSLTDHDLDLLRLERKHPDEIHPLAAVDGKIKALAQTRPVYPRSQSGDGTATIEFLLDEDGTVHLPRILSASDPSFGYAAVQAVSVWRFEPAKVGGKLAIIRIPVPINFNRPNLKKPAAAK